MTKLKLFWIKHKFSLSGAVLGFIIPIIFYSVEIIYTNYFEFNPIIAIPIDILILPIGLILILISSILGTGSNDPYVVEGIAAIAFYLSPFFYAIVGSLIGYFMGRKKLKRKK